MGVTCLCETTLVCKITGMNENVSLRQLECLIMCIRDAYEPGLSISTPSLRLIPKAQGRHDRAGRPSCRPPARDLPPTECADFLLAGEETALVFMKSDSTSLQEKEHKYR